MVFAFDIETSKRLLMTLAVSRGFTPRHRIGDDVGQIAAGGESPMTFQSLNVVSPAEAI